MDLAEGVRQGDRRSLARLLSLIEDGTPEGEAALACLPLGDGRATTVGITGLPGAGKSTLVFGLATELRRRGRTVGVLAIDPSSPFTHGSLLGDRVRMQDLGSDPGVFIRSMATRGAQGGLAVATLDAMTALEAFGLDVVLVETVGAGQDEVDVMRAVQTVVVVEMPGAGDEVQSQKAGILEIADIYVVNKADLPGAEAAEAHLRQALSLQSPTAWTVPIVKTVALSGTGIEQLADAVGGHQSWLRESGRLTQRLRARAEFQLMALAQHRLRQRLETAAATNGLLAELTEMVLRGELSPSAAAAQLLAAAEALSQPAAEGDGQPLETGASS